MEENRPGGQGADKGRIVPVELGNADMCGLVGWDEVPILKMQCQGNTGLLQGELVGQPECFGCGSNVEGNIPGAWGLAEDFNPGLFQSGERFLLL